MIRVNKHFALFSGILLLLGLFSVVLLERLYPLMSHTAYYCQSVMQSFLIKVPVVLRLLPILLISTLLSIAVIKFLAVILKMIQMKKRLIKQIQHNAEFSRLTKELGLTDLTYLVKNEKPFAFCLGMRKPKIYISTTLFKLLKRKELEAVLRHEEYHLRSNDTLTMLLASLGQSLLPFLPLFSDVLHRYRIDRELAADHYAVQVLGSENPLISALKKILTFPFVSPAYAASFVEENSLEERINVLVKRKVEQKYFSKNRLLISMLFILTILFVTFAPVQAEEIHRKNIDLVIVSPEGNLCKPPQNIQSLTIASSHLTTPRQ